MKLLKAVTTTSTGLAILLVTVVSLNIIASKLLFRADLTEDKVYSLSDGTRNIIKKLDRDVTVKLFFSRSIKELPIPIKTYATRVEEVLQEYQNVSAGRITVEVIDPKPDTDDEEWAQKYGINGVRLPKGDQMFFGVVLIVGSQEFAIPYLDPRREEFLEYDLSEAMINTMRKEKSKIGIMSSLPVLGGAPQANQEGDGTWALVNDLKRNFNVEKIETSAKEIGSDFKVVIVLHPKDIGADGLYALDQYVVQGGRLIVAVDPMSRTDLQINGDQMRTTGQMPKTSSDLGPLLAAWDIDFEPGKMVGDTTFATQINAGGSMTAYPFFMSLSDANFAQNSVITGNLKMMLIAEGGAVSHKAGATSKFDPLITLTKDSGTIEAQMAAFMMPADLARDMKSDGKERYVAAMVTGKFKSAYPNGRPAPASPEGQQPPGQPHKAEADKETSIVVIADVDLFADNNAVEKFRFGPQIMVRARNDNLNFLFNAADFLGGSEDLIAIRSKGRIARPFSRVAEIQKNAQKRWQTEEEALTSQLTDLQKKLGEMQSQRTDGNRFVLNAEQQSEINRFRDEERQVKKRRREVRKSLREDIEKLGHQVVAANMLFVPLAATALGLGLFVRRGRRYRKDRHGERKQ